MKFKQFKKLAEQYKTIPVYRRVLADLLTPISVFMKLAKTSDYAFILESVEGGEQYSRYSFIGCDPKQIIKSENDKVYIKSNGFWESIEVDFLSCLRKIHKSYQTPKLDSIPNFTGGLVGYLGYESIVWVEDIPVYDNDMLINTPDAIFMLFEELIAFDHLKNQIILFSNVKIDLNKNLKDSFDAALEKIDIMGERLHQDIDFQTVKVKGGLPTESNFSESKFKEAILLAQDHIKSGDIFQLVLSQRFKRKTTVSPYAIYRALRTINPSPYMFHLKLSDFEVIGASPELLVKVENNNIQIRPIAGTRKRGNTSKEDVKLADELLNDEKELAEHLMLVDLGRNDVGRSAEYDSVEIFEFMKVEYYSHVMHIVSDIGGKLRNDKDVFDALYSGFPAGTLTGAPKLRAMEIIHELEPSRRGVYSGAIGYFDFSGDMNTCIAIRTMVIKDNYIFFQAGAGIVNDSNPVDEFQETINKARVIEKAIDFAENGLL